MSINDSWKEGMAVITYHDNTASGGRLTMGFTDRTMKRMIKPEYESVGLFSEGLARVGKRNEFKEMKYGFIDKSGKLVIPLKYTNPPQDFHSERAMVEPVGVSEFHHGFIDKSDNLIIKLKDYHRLTYSYEAGFNSGYMNVTNNASGQGRVFIMDSVGMIVSMKDFFAAADNNKLFTNYEQSFRFNDIIINNNFLQFDAYDGSKSYATLVDLKAKRILFPKIFSWLSGYDPVSKFRQAEKTLNNVSKIKGYINREGVFKIVLGSKNVF